MLAAFGAVVIYQGVKDLDHWTPAAALDHITHQCWRNAYACRDFGTHAKAQATYLACGGLKNDVHRLDTDWDGMACERLP